MECAWEARLDGQSVIVLYDSPRELLVPALLGKRRTITEVRPALSGYQKGHCFYCYSQILVTPNSRLSTDVDHFFPHVLMSRGLPIDLDGVWNLVLACRECNRGHGGKMASVPGDPHLEHLRLRNEYLIQSDHPLRETLIKESGQDTDSRRRFLRRVRDHVESLHGKNNWQPTDYDRPVFG